MAERQRRDFLIIGAGRAGLGAALEAARAGVDTCVLDVRSRDDVEPELLRDTIASGVEVRFDTSAWGIWGRTVAVYPAGGVAERITAEQVLIATGARPRPVVFPGWQLPGVTTGWDLSGRVLLAGSGPGLSQRAVDLHRDGVTVCAIVEATSAAFHADSEAYLRTSGVDLRNRHLLVRAEGSDRVERAILARVNADWRVQPATESVVEVDSIVLDYGQVPRSELSRLSGCRHAHKGLDGIAPVHDDWMRTDVSGILVAGDVCGSLGPDIALEQGRLAGAAAALALGSLSVVEAERAARAMRTRLRRLTVERRRTWSGYRLGHGMFELAQPDTLVCHCENVSAAEIQAAVIGISPDPAPVRGETRAGMGICQARDCARQIEALVAQATGVPLERVPPLSVRPPVLPIPLGAIAERPFELV